MYKLLILCTLLTACDHKLAWVSTKPEEVKAPALPELKNDIQGVQFTFDDGPDLAKTPKILDILKAHNLHATFFVEGINLAGTSVAAQARRDLLIRMVDEGHTIGNHTFDHKDLCRVSSAKAAQEIDSTTELIEKTTGQKVTLFRAPYGKKCRMLTGLLAKRNLTAVYWEIDPREWERDSSTHQFKTSQQVIDGILAQYRALHFEQGLPKMTIILHDTKAVTVELLPTLLSKLPLEVEKKQ